MSLHVLKVTHFFLWSLVDWNFGELGRWKLNKNFNFRLLSIYRIMKRKERIEKMGERERYRAFCFLRGGLHFSPHTGLGYNFFKDCNFVSELLIFLYIFFFMGILLFLCDVWLIRLENLTCFWGLKLCFQWSCKLKNFWWPCHMFMFSFKKY